MRMARARWLFICRSDWCRLASSKPEMTMLMAIIGILGVSRENHDVTPDVIGKCVASKK